MTQPREDESPLQILVADDDSATRMLLNIALTKWGYQVLEAEDGDIAWRRISHPGAPQLLILDCSMPHQDGYTLCTRIRTELAPDYNPYIILLTQNNGQENVIQGLDAGANEFLTKPFNAAELRSRVLVGERIVRYEDALQTQNERLQEYISKIETASSLVVNAAQSLSQAMKEAHENGDELFASRYHDMKRAHSTLDEIIEVFSNYQPGKEPRKPE